MKIASIDIIRTESVEQPLYPYVKPTDYYANTLGQISPVKAALLDQISFLRLKTDEGIESYIAVSKVVADFVLKISGVIYGFDLTETSKAWDLLYRYTMPLGRGGLVMHSISAIDLLMYDALGKSLDIPVYSLVGGKTREKIRAYASHLHPLPAEELAKEAISYVEEGYRTMKMRFVSGPSDPYAVEKNLGLVKTVRDTIGYSLELAADAWMSWNYNFARTMISKLEKYELAWVEEPLLPDDFEAYSLLTRVVETPISAGEHHYFLHDMKRLLDAGVRILQPDTVWTGGITSMKKIAALAEAYGATVIPHTSNIYNLHFIMSEKEAVTPMSEFLTKYREWMEQHVTNVPKPDKGYFTLPEGSGFGIKYDFH
jgi:L-alanine-DL-glutamate epimerase-like enolase superfamily enzyme